jgi:hypothetical protein
MGVSPDDLTPRQRSNHRDRGNSRGRPTAPRPFRSPGLRAADHRQGSEWPGRFSPDPKMTDHTIVVLTSGDPLFYGIGVFLVRRLGAERVRILPNVSAVAAGFARLGEPWQDVRVVSLHGRNHTGRLFRSPGREANRWPSIRTRVTTRRGWRGSWWKITFRTLTYVRPGTAGHARRADHPDHPRSGASA